MCTFMMRAGWPAPVSPRASARSFGRYRCHQQYLSDAKNRTGTARTTAQACRARLVWLAPTAEAAEAVSVWVRAGRAQDVALLPATAPRHSPESREHYRRRPATPRTASSASRCIPPRWAITSPPSGGRDEQSQPGSTLAFAPGRWRMLGVGRADIRMLHASLLRLVHLLAWRLKSGRGTSACPSQVAPSHPAPPWAGIASAPTGEVWMFAALGG
jgi:hypothetical protein